jgi:crotonobetaine/carnitine-CoA ligase
VTAVTQSLAEYVMHHAAMRPEHPALRIEDEALTYQELADSVQSVAGGLSELGVAAGDTVALLLPNCVEFVVSWLALGQIGAAAAPLNTTLGREGLANALALTRAEIAIIADRHLPVLRDMMRTSTTIRKVVLVRARTRPDLGTIDVFDWSQIRSTLRPRAETHPGDPSILLFTSGSTGRSKACVLPHRYVTRQAEIFIDQMRLTQADVLFCPFPLFHADAAIFTVAPALMLGATAALVERFSVRSFWDQVRRYEATVFDFMGATLTMLFKQQPDAADGDNPARLGWGVPLPHWAKQFEDRFGVELVEVYGLSDAGIVLYNQPGEPRRAGSCGRPVPPFDVRVLDECGFECTPGSTGEICIRPLEPHIILTEYLGMPEATVQAWRDLWFHTGDLAYRDSDGYFYFVGRNKDVIRRRGENISALAIEEQVGRHPAVLEAAAFGVPSELTEDDVMITVALRPGSQLTEAALLAYCEKQLPRHMVPRYIDFVEALPKTPTEKIEKHVLAERGVSTATFDSQRAGRVNA